MARLRSAIAVSVVLVACSNNLPLTETDQVGPPGLLQQVFVDATTIHQGDSLTVRSVMRNRGTSAVTVEIGEIGGCGDAGIVVTGLSFQTRPDTAACAGGLLDVPLQPGDSIVAVTVTPPVTSQPGDYTLVAHQVRTPNSGSPIGGAEIGIRVMAR
jgi:hypothetical protein